MASTESRNSVRTFQPAHIIGFVLGGIMVVVGILILTGVLHLKAGWHPTFGTVFGVVVLLFGAYRIAVTDAKRRRDIRRMRNDEVHE